MGLLGPARRGRPLADAGRGETTRSAILLAAAREFREKGYSGARLADIAARVSMKAAIVTHLELVLANEDIASATIKLIWQAPPDIRERQLSRQRDYGALWRLLLTEAREAGAIRKDLDLSVVRMATMGAPNWAADWYSPGRMTPTEIARDIAAMIMGGLTTG